MMATSIYFVRHGEVLNPKAIWYGRLPGFGLTKKGKEQAEETAEYLRGKHIDAVYTSPQLRARQTAKIIAKKLGLKKVYTSSILAEIDSSMQGQLFSTLHKRNYDVFSSPKESIRAETVTELLGRMEDFIEKMIKKHPGKRVVAVSHGDPIMILRAKLLGLPITNASLRPENPDHYIKHAQIFHFTRLENNEETLETIFTPRR